MAGKILTNQIQILPDQSKLYTRIRL